MVVVLLLLIDCVLSPTIICVGSVVGLCFGMYYFISFVVLQSSREGREPNCFAFIVFWVSCYFKCRLAINHSVIGWSAICDCGIS